MNERRPGGLGGLWRRLAVALCVLGAAGSAAAQREAGWASLQDGSIVLMRHASAPGVGDPPGFRLGACETQRNLDAAGRAQARRIGAQFRAHQVPVTAVRSSQWCRTHETATLAFGALVQDDPRFNSFFGEASREAAQTADARAALRAWRGPGVLVVVTHQVNVTALTGEVPGAGEAVVVRPVADGLEVLGRLPL